MGRAIDMENEIDALKAENKEIDKRLKLVEDALEELVQTRVHHVDLVDEIGINDNVLEEEVEEVASTEN